MTHEAPSLHQDLSPAELQFFKLTAEQANELDRLGPGPEAEVLVASIGENVLRNGNMAVVVETDAEGNERPLHLMNLGDDLGTTVNLAKAGNAEKYPTLDEAYQLVSPDGDTETVESVDTGEVIARVVEDSGLSRIVTQYGQLMQAVEQGRQMDAVVLRDASDHVDGLLRQLNMAASNGPWAGNKLGNHQQLMRQAQETAEALRSSAARLQYSNEATQQETRRFGQHMDASSEEAQPKLAQIDAPEAQHLRSVTQQVAEAVAAATPLARQLGDDRLQGIRLVAQQLESICYDGSLTVDDAAGMIHRARYMLEEASDSSTKSSRLYDELTHDIERLATLLRR